MTNADLDRLHAIKHSINRCKAELVRVEQMISRDMIELVNLDAPWLAIQLASHNLLIEQIYLFAKERQLLSPSGTIACSELLAMFRSPVAK